MAFLEGFLNIPILEINGIKPFVQYLRVVRKEEPERMKVNLFLF